MQAAEAEKKAQAAQNKTADGPQLEADEGNDLDPNQYHERRLRALETTRASGRNPYPHKFKLTMYIPAYVAKYKDIEAGTRQEGQSESLAGDYKFSDIPTLLLHAQQMLHLPSKLTQASAGSRSDHMSPPLPWQALSLLGIPIHSATRLSACLLNIHKLL